MLLAPCGHVFVSVGLSRVTPDSAGDPVFTLLEDWPLDSESHGVLEVAALPDLPDGDYDLLTNTGDHAHLARLLFSTPDVSGLDGGEVVFVPKTGGSLQVLPEQEFEGRACD